MKPPRVRAHTLLKAGEGGQEMDIPHGYVGRWSRRAAGPGCGLGQALGRPCRGQARAESNGDMLTRRQGALLLMGSLPLRN